MPRLSAIDSVNPAMARVKWMLLPFRLTTWLKVGLIGWLAGEAVSGGFNFNFPGHWEMPSGIPGPHFPTGIMGAMIAVIAVIVALIVAFGLVMLYVSCRFRFVLFDSVVHGQANIERGWSAYPRAASRYFGFSAVFGLTMLVAGGLAVGLPLWRAYKQGVFRGGDVIGPVLVLLGTVFAGLAVLGVVAYVVSTLVRDFVAPLLALDDLRLGEAWSAVWKLVKSEPGAFAGYIAMKLILAMAAAFLVGIATFLCFLVLLIPGAIVIALIVAIVSALKSAVAIGIIAGFGVTLLMAFVALMFGVIWIVSAPVSVFFESYRLCFFAGRYPKLEALVWPQTATP